MLANKPLSNFELVDVARTLDIPSFRGVFLLDMLPKKPNKKECGIVNFEKKVVAPARIGSLGIKTVKLRSTSIATACNLRSKLLSTWEDKNVITLINFNQRGKYFEVICVYMFSKNSAQVTNSKAF